MNRYRSPLALATLLLVALAGACGEDSENTSTTNAGSGGSGAAAGSGAGAGGAGAGNTVALEIASNSGMTTEGGGVATFEVTLANPPSETVTVTPSSDATDEGTVDGTPLTFGPADWNVAQTVTVTGVDDDIEDGAQMYAVVLAAESGDANFNGQLDVPITNADDDMAGVAVGLASDNTDEGGGVATFDVVLESEPTSTVTLNLASDNVDEGLTDVAMLTFQPTDWDTPQTVTVTGQDDGVADGAVAYSVVFSATTSDDAIYAAITPASVALVNDPVAIPCAYPGDDFEDGDISDWTVNGVTATTDASAAAEATTLGLQVTGANGHYAVRRDFAAQTPSYISIWVRASNTTQIENYVAFGDADLATNEGLVFTYASATDWRVIGDTSLVVGTVVVDQFEHFEYFIDWTNKTTDVHMNGTLVADDLGFRSPSTTELEAVALYNFTIGGTGRWDELLMICD